MQPAADLWGTSGEESSWELSQELVLGAVPGLQAGDLDTLGSGFAEQTAFKTNLTQFFVGVDI